MRILILVLFCLFSLPLGAQDRPLVLKDNESLEGDFLQKRYLQGFERPIVSSGRFYFSKAEGLLWKTLSPFATDLRIDENGIRQWIDGEETMNVSPAQFPALATLHDVLSKSMQGHWQVLENQYGVQLETQGQGWQLDFKAGDQAPFKALSLSGAAYLDRLIIEKPAGDRDEIVFSNHKISMVKE